jgi:hypothetical protein
VGRAAVGSRCGSFVRVRRVRGACPDGVCGCGRLVPGAVCVCGRTARARGRLRLRADGSCPTASAAADGSCLGTSAAADGSCLGTWTGSVPRLWRSSRGRCSARNVQHAAVETYTPRRRTILHVRRRRAPERRLCRRSAGESSSAVTGWREWRIDVSRKVALPATLWPPGENAKPRTLNGSCHPPRLRVKSLFGIMAAPDARRSMGAARPTLRGSA